MAWRLSPWLPHIVDKITKPDKCTPKIEEKKDDYVLVEYESPILGIVDDEEFWFPPGKKSMVEYRSASRIGNFDFDANRKRIKLMCFIDLEIDYINHYDSAVRINKVVMPEFIIQAVFCLVCLITGHYFLFFPSLPYSYYNFILYRRRKHLVDVTEIFNQLEWEKKQRLIKLGYLIILLIVFIFWLIWTVGKDDY
ncbi:probable protein cornichon homolog 2 [Gossypium raimondii]|uniref:probable protein cornichon homolog 2 n=1 Tax=Gossypium raimondii TaxID=29730 RepID=UPI00227B5758|nr:probable protein cornichon homolog 2 [Gossypium raimondii]